VGMTGGTLNTLVAGAAQGAILRLRAPISFWGGVHPETGRISDPRHPDFGAEINGRILVLPGAIGSSSSSAVMLELLHRGRAPAAVVLAERDAILVLGVLVARELGIATIPMVEGPCDLATGILASLRAEASGTADISALA